MELELEQTLQNCQPEFSSFAFSYPLVSWRYLAEVLLLDCFIVVACSAELLVILNRHVGVCGFSCKAPQNYPKEPEIGC